MREIKFRAWMIAGKYMKAWEDLEHINLWAYANHDGIFELMQYTGLKDKNGIEIYEGDIIKVIYAEAYDDDPDNRCPEESSLHQVVWDEDYPAFDLKPFPDGWESNGLQYAQIEYKIQIIGNIYDNPDLLEAKGDKLKSPQND